MKSGKSYVKDTGDFLEKIKSLGRIPEDVFLVTADVVGLYPSIPHDVGVKALYEKLEERSDKKVPSGDLVHMAEFVLKNNFFEFGSKVKQQVSGTAIGTKFAPPYACIFMDKVEVDFLETQVVKLLVWLRYIDDISFIWNESDEKLDEFLENLNNFHPNLKFTSEKFKKSVNFLDVKVSLIHQHPETDLYCKPTDCHQFLDFNSAHPIHIKKSIVFSQFTPPPFVSFRAGFSLRKHLVRDKVYPLLRECESSGCNKSRCQTCLNVNNTDVFQSFVTKETYKINHKLDFDSKCIIYFFSCKTCGLQYLGSTVERFRFRWNNYKNCQREAAQGGTPSQSFFHQHFLSEGHHGLVKDCEITLIDKTDSSDATRREFFWIRLLKIYYPLGLNIEEEI